MSHGGSALDPNSNNYIGILRAAGKDLIMARMLSIFEDHQLEWLAQNMAEAKAEPIKRELQRRREDRAL